MTQTPIYVFSQILSDDCLVSTDRRITVVYRKIQTHKTDAFAPDVVTFKGRRYPVTMKRANCGVFALPCIFV